MKFVLLTINCVPNKFFVFLRLCYCVFEKVVVSRNMEGSGHYDDLISAIQGGKLKRVKKLIDIFTIPETEQFSCFCLAVFYDQTNIVKLFLQHEFVFLNKSTNTCPATQIAAHNNNLEIIEALLEKGVETDSSTEAFILYLATWQGNEKILKFLLRKGVDIHQKVRGPFSCIHIAVERKYFQIIEFLLSNGADVNARYPVKNEPNAGGTTILHRAVQIESTALVELLLKYGADINIKSDDGVTALHIAAKRGLVQIAKLLIQNGAKVNSTTASVVEREFYRKKFHESQTRRFFLGAEFGNVTNPSVHKGACTPLHVAVKCSQKKLVKLLLEHDANVDAQDSQGNTALSLAVEIGCPTIVALILTHHPNKENESNRNALYSAAKFCGKDYNRIIESLLRFGFSCGSRDLINYDLLFNAVRNNHIQIVRQILDAGANVNELSIAGDSVFQELFAETLLSLAVKCGTEDLVRLLIEYGANVNSKSERGRYPISCAIESLNLEITKLLLAKGAKVQNDPEILLFAVQKGCLELVQILLNHGANVKRVVVTEHFSIKSSQYKPYTGNQTDESYLSSCGVTAIFIAAQEGFVDIVKLLLEHGANKNFRVVNDMTPLLIAVVGGHFKTVEFLLKSGVNVHSADSDGRTALYLAAEFGHEEVLKLLLKHGAILDCGCKNEMTPLLIAVTRGHFKVASTLIKFGANVNSGLIVFIAAKFGHNNLLKHLLKYLLKNNTDFNYMGSDGRTPLILSAAAGHFKIVEVLLAHGANVNLASLDNKTALYMAAYEGHHAVLQLLLKYGAQVDFKNTKNETALFVAATKGHHEIVETLIKFGACIDASDHLGSTPLTIATKQGHDEVVKVLLARGANYDLEAEGFRSPLLMFAKKGHLNIVEILLKSGSSLDTVDCNGKTALHLALEYNHTSVVKLLLKHGAKVNIADKKGKTPLLISVEKGCLKTVGALLKHDASIEYTDQFGRTALYFAAEYNRIDLVKHLLKFGANVNARGENGKTPLVISAERGNFKIIKILLKAGASVNAKDQDGFTALHFATEYGHIDSVKLLLEHGADVDSKTERGRTPLFISAKRGRPNAAEFLLKSGANVNSTDRNGLTALNFAAEYGHDKVVRSLLKYGAKVDCKTTGDIPLIVIAAERGHFETVLILLKWGAKIDLVNNTHLVTYLVATIHSWKSQVFQAVIEYGSADSKVLNETNLRPLFDILNRCARDRLHRSGIPQILVYHTVKMKVAGIYLGEENLVTTTFSDETEIEDFRVKCLAEIEMLKNEVVENSFFSFYDILMKDLNRLAIFVKNPRVDEIFRSDCYKLKFPIYASFLIGQVQKGSTRRALINHGVQIFSFFFRDLPSLPCDLIEKIVFYLSDQELRRLLVDFRPVIEYLVKNKELLTDMDTL